MLDTLKRWDRDVFIYLNNIGVERYDALWLFITDVLNWIPLYIFFVALFFYYYPKRQVSVIFLYLILVLVLTTSLTGLVKQYVARLRPGEVEMMAELIRVLQKPSRFSFFSGHASFSFALTTYVVATIRSKTKWIYLCLLWPVLISLSRIYVGVHYPSDLVVGAFVGFGIAMAGYFQCEKTLKKRSLNHT